MVQGFTQTNVSERVEKIIHAQIASDAALSQETHLQNDLGMDSLEMVELGIALENEFGVELPDADVRRCATLNDIVRLVNGSEPEERASSV